MVEERRVAVVVGGGRGIGRALAAELTRAGGGVVVIENRPPPVVYALERVQEIEDLPEMPCRADLAVMTGRPQQTRAQWRKEMKGRK